MADGEPQRRPLADKGFLRFLLPAPKPNPGLAPSSPSSPPAQLAPPHRLITPPLPLPRPRPDERFFILPPTRPSWIPPPPPPPPPPPLPAPRPFPAGAEPRMRNAGYFSGRNGPMGRKFGAFVGNGDRADFERRNVGGGLSGINGGEAGVEKRKVAAQREEKVWVAVERKGENGSDEGQAAAGGGYEGGDERGLEAEDQLEPEDEQDGDGRPLGEDVVNSLVIAGGDHECHDGGGGDRPSEHLNSQSDQAPHLRVRMRRQWVECRHDIDTFTSGLLSIYESLKLSEEHKSKQKNLVDPLAKSVSKE